MKCLFLLAIQITISSAWGGIPETCTDEEVERASQVFLSERQAYFDGKISLVQLKRDENHALDLALCAGIVSCKEFCAQKIANLIKIQDADPSPLVAEEVLNLKKACAPF